MSNYGQAPQGYGAPMPGGQPSPAPGAPNPYQSAVYQPPQQGTPAPMYEPGAQQQPAYGPAAGQQPMYGPGTPQQPTYGPGAGQHPPYGAGVPQYGPQAPHKSSNSVGNMYKQAVSTGKPMLNKLGKTISSKLGSKDKTQVPDYLQSYGNYQTHQQPHNPYGSQPQQNPNPHQAQQPQYGQQMPQQPYGTPASVNSGQGNYFAGQQGQQPISGPGTPNQASSPYGNPQQQLHSNHSQHGSYSGQQPGMGPLPQAPTQTVTPTSGNRISMYGAPAVPVQPGHQQQNPSPAPSQSHNTPPPQQYGGTPNITIQPNQPNQQQQTPLQQLQQHAQQMENQFQQQPLQQHQQISPAPPQGQPSHPNQPQQPTFSPSPVQQQSFSQTPPLQQQAGAPSLPLHPNLAQQQQSPQAQQQPQQYGNVSPLIAPAQPASPGQPSSSPPPQSAGSQPPGQYAQTGQMPQRHNPSLPQTNDEQELLSKPSQDAQQDQVPQQFQQPAQPQSPPVDAPGRPISNQFVAELPAEMGNLNLSNDQPASHSPSNAPATSPYQAYQPPAVQNPSTAAGFAIPRRAVSTSTQPLADPWSISDPTTELPTREFYIIADLVFEALDRKYEPRNTGLIEASKLLESWKYQELPDEVAKLFAFNNYTAFARLWSLEQIPHIMVPCPPHSRLVPRWDFQEQAHAHDLRISGEFLTADAPYPRYIPALTRQGWCKSLFIEAMAEPVTLEKMISSFCMDTYKPGMMKHPDLGRMVKDENPALAERARGVRAALQRVCQDMAAAMQHEQNV